MQETAKEQDLKRKGFISTLSLFFQSGYSAFLGLIANLILTILLSPTIFGIYITVLSLISFMNYFSDIGLAGALIQKKELVEDDLITTFTIQQVLTLALVILGILGTGLITKFYKLPPDGITLYWALLIAFFISSFKTIPSVFLERKIEFQKIVFVQIIESTVFYISVSVLALMGFGLKSFTISVLLRSVVGLILIYKISFWLPKVGVSKASVKELLSFGAPFQASSFLALFKDDLIVLYLGKVLGFQGLGYIGWAKKWADAPLRIVMDNVSKVIFPLVASFQDQTEKVKKLSEKILYFQTAILAPFFLGMIMIMRHFVEVIPKYQKWAPALPLFYIFAISSLILSFSAPFMNLFNALGKVKLSFSFMLLFTFLTWILTPALTNLFGIFGFPIAHIIISITFALVIVKAKRLINFDFASSVFPFLVSTICMAVLLYTIEVFVKLHPLILISLQIVIGTTSYFFLLIFIFKINIITEARSFFARKESYYE